MDETLKQSIADGLQAWRDAGSPVKSREEQFKEKPTRKLAIDLQCISCMGGDKALIKECNSSVCWLVQYRPYK